MKYIGIVNETEISELYSEVKIPDDATIINGINSLNIYAQIGIQTLIMITLLTIAIVRIKKIENGIKLKDIFRDKKIIEKMNNKKNVFSKVLYAFKLLLLIPIILFVITLISVPIHEIIHGIFMYGHNVYLGINTDYAIAFALYIGSIVSLLAPFIILGIMPFIVIIILYPRKIKNKTIYMMLVWCIICIMCSAAPDLITTINIVNNVPNGAQIISTVENDYWYINE
jgi:hypothetical protein